MTDIFQKNSIKKYSPSSEKIAWPAIVGTPSRKSAGACGMMMRHNMMSGGILIRGSLLAVFCSMIFSWKALSILINIIVHSVFISSRSSCSACVLGLIKMMIPNPPWLSGLSPLNRVSFHHDLVSPMIHTNFTSWEYQV